MTQPALAHATDFGRMYARRLGEDPQVPSITTVIGMQSANLDGWAGYLAAQTLAGHDGLPAAVGRPEAMRPLVREAASAAERYREAAAARGDRVHAFAEQIALRALGREHDLASAREQLAEHGETAFADCFEQWWQQYAVRPLAPEVTIWNHTVGYAGTLDLVAEIAGRLCLIDFKTKGLDRYGQVKALDPRVVMQLTAAMKAEEMLLDAAQGSWQPWAFPQEYGQEPLLLAVALSEREVVLQRANPNVLASHWYKFCSLHRLWQRHREAALAGPALLPVPPPRQV